jgi:hypothetical protein
MPDHEPTPTDLAARAAFAAFCRCRKGYGGVADQFEIRPQTASRIYKGKRPVPHGIAREIAAEAAREGLKDIAATLLAWADERQP